MSCPDLIRASSAILAKSLDCRVKPGNDNKPNTPEGRDFQNSRWNSPWNARLESPLSRHSAASVASPGSGGSSGSSSSLRVSCASSRLAVASTTPRRRGAPWKRWFLTGISLRPDARSVLATSAGIRSSSERKTAAKNDRISSGQNKPQYGALSDGWVTYLSITTCCARLLVGTT